MTGYTPSTVPAREDGSERAPRGVPKNVLDGVQAARRLAAVRPDGDLAPAWANAGGEPPHQLIRDLDKRSS